MLLLPAIEAGESLLEPSVYPAAELLTDLSNELRVLAGHYEFISDIDDDLPDLEVDRERFQQVLMNVVGNAYKYSPPEGRIVMTARREGQEVIVSISDSGPGHPSRWREKVFEKYAPCPCRTFEYRDRSLHRACSYEGDEGPHLDR